MKKELIAELFQKFENTCYLLGSVECWSARELQVIFNYSKWDNILNVIQKAKESNKPQVAKGCSLELISFPVFVSQIDVKNY
ncbi:MAG: hypothetical protein KJ666_09040 [Bacteroidetes bacterium]|nr:hypothetical protein [Bacteroidota bacterium]MBU2586308.1 hypothetical protein [Bacteroidota bacterium]